MKYEYTCDKCGQCGDIDIVWRETEVNEVVCPRCAKGVVTLKRRKNAADKVRSPVETEEQKDE